MPPVPDVPAAVPAVPDLLILRADPSSRLVAFALVCAVAVGAGSIWLMNALSVVPMPWLTWPLGIVLGLCVLPPVLRGTELRIEGDGTVTYAQNGRDNLRFQLRDIGVVSQVATGALVGVGLAIDPERVEFLHHKGVTRRHLDSQQRDLGCAVVLEGFGETDAAAIRARLAMQPAPTSAGDVEREPG